MKCGEAGAEVLLVARTPEKLEETKAEIEEAGGTAYIHQCDLSDLDDVERMAKEVLDQHERVDILVNNAGRSIRRSIENSYDRFHDFERTMQLNYFGALRLIISLLPSMRKRSKGRKGGHIINISSIGVQTNTPSVLGVRRLQGRARRVVALRRLGGRRRRRQHHHDPHAAGSDADDRPDQDV